MNSKLTGQSKRCCQLALLLIAATLAACGGEDIARPQLPPGQLVSTIQLGDPELNTVRQFPGRVIAHQRAELAVQVSGPLVELPISEGTRVAAGDVLARIDPRDFENALAARQADVKEAEAQYQRFKKALASKAVTETQFEEAQASFEVAQALLTQAQKDLDDTTLRAPFDGLVARRHVENFQNVQAGQPILTLEDISQLDIIIQLPEQDLIHIPSDRRRALGREAGTVIFTALPDTSFPVTIKAFQTKANPETQTYKITLTLPAPAEATILPGMTATFTPLGSSDQRQQLFAIPINAVTAGSDGRSYAWVVDQASMTVSRRELQLGAMRGAQIQVLDGLDSGDTVVVEGAFQLAEGMAVRLQNDTGA